LKLVQFRFAERHKIHASQVGQTIQSIFSVEDDGKVKTIYATRESGPRYRLVRREVVHKIAAEGFEKSFARNLSYGEVFAISSIGSCRFVVFEEGGLIRMCLSNDDESEVFEEFATKGEDVSDLLVSTDIFDYL
jgi:hypothetical protein